MKLAFFDTKSYDRPGFDAHAAGTDIEIKYFETKLGEDTVQLAKGFDGVCVFVNDTVNAKVADELYRLGVRVIALRCAGFNNVDTKACFGKLHVFRVPAYSPYAVAEHAMALLLTVNRHTNKAYIRTRDFNFSLSGLTGFDLHGKTVGVIGTGKIGRIFAEICKGFGTITQKTRNSSLSGVYSGFAKTQRRQILSPKTALPLKAQRLIWTCLKTSAL